MPDARHVDAEHFTGGARRTLRRAEQAAVHLGAPQVEPVHLLWALTVDEGRAGIRLQELSDRGMDLTQYEPALAALDVDELDRVAGSATWPTETLSLVREARHVAFEQGAAEEVSSNHLLIALTRIPSSVSPLLTALDANERPAEAVESNPSTPHVPLEVPGDLRLQLRDRAAPNLSQLYRILDAAANRAREGLRVAEDYFRFGLNDAFLTEQLKRARHQLTEILSAFPDRELLAARDTTGDVGTTISTASEYRRIDFADVLLAALKRTEEALRTLEEFGKVASAEAGRRIERLRYDVYTLEKSALQILSARERLQGQQLYLLLTDAQCPTGVDYVLKQALDAGVRLFQIREKTWSDRRLIEHCRAVRRRTREAGALLIINDRPDIAVLCDADGVHVGQDELSVADARRIVGPAALVGVSTHSLEQARQAVRDGADYLGVGPTFPSGTKSFGEFPGIDFVRAVAAEITLPWFAIGGIDDTNVHEVAAAGASRVAVTRAVSAADFPASAAGELLEVLRRAEIDG